MPRPSKNGGVPLFRITPALREQIQPVVPRRANPFAASRSKIAKTARRKREDFDRMMGRG